MTFLLLHSMTTSNIVYELNIFFQRNLLFGCKYLMAREIVIIIYENSSRQIYFTAIEFVKKIQRNAIVAK